MTATSPDSTQGPEGAAPTLSARALDGLGAITAPSWDALVLPRDEPLRHGYLTAWERSELPGLRSRPLVACQQGSERPSAACPGYLYQLDMVGVRLPAAARLLRPIRHLWPGFLRARTYELGSPTTLTSPFCTGTAPLQPETVRALIGVALEEGRRAGAQFLLVQNFTSLAGPVADELRRLGFAGIPMPPTAVVDLCFDSFDDYLDSMRAHYRRKAHDALKLSEGLHVERREQFAPLADQLAHLWRLVFDRATEVKREILTADYFREVSRLRSSSVLLARREDGSLAAFGLLLAEHPWLTFVNCGFDEDAGRSEGAYFRLLYEVVRFGIEGGFKQAELGITTLEPKLEIGGVPVPLFAWVRHHNPVIHRLLTLYAKGPMREHQLEPRHVFKEPPSSAAELVSQRAVS